jgi:hypothetical protein
VKTRAAVAEAMAAAVLVAVAVVAVDASNTLVVNLSSSGFAVSTAEPD